MEYTNKNGQWTIHAKIIIKLYVLLLEEVVRNAQDRIIRDNNNVPIDTHVTRGSLRSKNNELGGDGTIAGCDIG